MISKKVETPSRWRGHRGTPLDLVLESRGVPATPLSERDVVARRGRRAGLVVYVLVVAGFSVVCSVQVLRQVFAPEVRPVAGCAAGLAELELGLDGARRAVAEVSGAGESQALQRFRAALAPSWSSRGGVGQACATDPAGQRRLTQLDRLRYAEEQAVRYEARELAELRLQLRRREAEAPPGARAVESAPLPR